VDDVLTAPALQPPVALSSGPLGAVQAADREIARQTAVRARAVAAFAASRPASADRAPGSPGAMSAARCAARAAVLRPVSEWATQELAVALSLSSEAAQGLLERSLTLVHRLPATLDALEAGVLHPGHLWPLLDKVAPLTDDTVRAALEADLLAWAARRGTVCTPAQLGDKARREVLRRNLRAAADDLARAIRKRGVSARPDRCDGMSVVSALLTTPEAAALVAALGAYADALPADGRSRGQQMADCLLDLVLRPGESSLPPVQVSLSVIAPLGALLGGDAPCEIDGHVVPAEVVRALLTALTGHRFTDPDSADTTAADTAADDTKPADTATADTKPADTATDDTKPADTATDDTKPAGTGEAIADRATAMGEDDPLAGISDADAAAYAAEADALAAWWDRIERRLAAGEFDRDPGPDDPDDPGPDHFGPDGSWPPDLDWPSDLDRLADSGRSPDDDPAPPAGDGWWARADDAVTAASDAVLTAQQALGHARRLVATAARADTTDHAAWQAGPAGRVTAAPDALGQLAAATDQARQSLVDLLGATAGGGLTDRPRLVLTHALTGALLTLTDLPALHRAARAGTGLTLPAATGGYRPGAALDRHVRARDRRCRFPGCRRPVPRSGELDHAVPWPAGETSAANLTGYCTSHHRGKHQAPGWRHHREPDGTLTVTTPTGLTATTTPPPY
jgi:hypothetical protein